jgi:competence protein ComEC
MRTRLIHLIYALFCTIFVLGYSVSTAFTPTTELRVSVLDVGQGDAIYIEAPNGRTMLVDGGPRGSLVAPLKAAQTIPKKHIDVFVLTNPDADHFAGILDLVKTYSIGVVVESGTRSTSKSYQSFDRLVTEEKIPRLIAKRGMGIVLDQKQNIKFSVLFPDTSVSGWSHNDASIVGRLTYGSRSFMFTGDATALTESIVRVRNDREILKSDVLKIGHHGSRTSTSEAFLDAVSPTYAIVSYGMGNTYGHPHREVVDRVRARDITLLETAKEGTVTCTTDGEKLECAGEN